MIDYGVPTEPWERPVAALLSSSCQPTPSRAARQELDQVVEETLALVTQPDPLTAAFQARLGLTALDVAADYLVSGVRDLSAAVIAVASSGAYAAREALGHHGLRSQRTGGQRQAVAAVLADASLGAGCLPEAHAKALTAAVEQAEGRLRTRLAACRQSRSAT
ncbi:hypothetical protein [Nonomuraea pusilla]|uniref:Uncharacterized protein n=1 Tax=Nonomuraea pusilla TaxID=46177 RepID=A0A1H7I656_9ACTN|nr:hypothetical protein [Nonomuraea pusilla]SEK57312.1 hypothetical protein SAMN05660976_00685 [Nonomuraea pusilla]